MFLLLFSLLVTWNCAPYTLHCFKINAYNAQTIAIWMWMSVIDISAWAKQFIFYVCDNSFDNHNTYIIHIAERSASYQIWEYVAGRLGIKQHANIIFGLWSEKPFRLHLLLSFFSNAIWSKMLCDNKWCSHHVVYASETIRQPKVNNYNNMFAPQFSSYLGVNDTDTHVMCVCVFVCT